MIHRCIGFLLSFLLVALSAGIEPYAAFASVEAPLLPSSLNIVQPLAVRDVGINAVNPSAAPIELDAAAALANVAVAPAETGAETAESAGVQKSLKDLDLGLRPKDGAAGRPIEAQRSFLGRWFDRLGKQSVSSEAAPVEAPISNDPLPAQSDAAPALAPHAESAAAAPQPIPAPQTGSWKDGLHNLPGSFKKFVAAGSVLSFTDEGISFFSNVYSFAEFRGFNGVLASGAELLFRIPGSLIGGWLIRRFDSKKIYIASTIVKSLVTLSLPVAFFLSPTGSIAFAHYLTVQIIRGVLYGATRGIAENEIMPKLVGQDEETLKVAGFANMVAVESTAIVAAAITGMMPDPTKIAKSISNIAVAALAVLTLTSMPFFLKIKLPDSKPAAGQSEKVAPRLDESGKADKLTFAEYIPYIASTFLHFSFYNLFSGIFAEEIFHSGKLMGISLFTYDGGSLAFGLMAAIPGLLLLGKPDDGKPHGVIDKLPLKAWFGVLAGAAAAYIWSSYAGTWLSLGALALMGGLVTVNRVKWMSYYQSRLKSSRHAAVFPLLNSAAIFASLALFSFIAAGQLKAVPVVSLLFYGNLIVTAALAASTAYSLRSRRQVRSGA